MCKIVSIGERGLFSLIWGVAPRYGRRWRRFKALYPPYPLVFIEEKSNPS
jgi:hypothetical protein